MEKDTIEGSRTLERELKKEGITVEVKMEEVHWSVYNMDHIYEMLHFVSERFYNVGCSQCKTMCCANQALEIQKDEQKELAKHLKMKPIEFRKKYTKTKENYLRGMCHGEGGKVVSKAGQSMMNAPGRILVFEESEDKIQLDRPITIDGKTHTECGVMYCPFYAKETHRCKVHDARPSACRIYPFLRVNFDTMEVRKATACLITDRFLERFIEMFSTSEIKSVQTIIKDIKEALATKEYYNHFYLPWHLVLMYLGLEFYNHGWLQLSVDLLKRLEREAAMTKTEARGK
jgi:Fe-S-cluster containining protein